MKFLQWLDKKDAVNIPEQESIDTLTKKKSKKSVLAEKIFEIENGVIDITSIAEEVVAEPVKFIHEATGKEYKTERSLKSAITRYNKKTPNTDANKSPIEPEKFIDEETGKEYKTASALKAGITRRKKKQKVISKK